MAKMKYTYEVDINEIEYIKNNGVSTMTVFMLKESTICLNYNNSLTLNKDIDRFMEKSKDLRDYKKCQIHKK